MDVPGRWAGGFRAWDEHGVYLATARGVDGRAGCCASRPSACTSWPTCGSPSPRTSSPASTARPARSRRRPGSAAALVTLGTLAAGLAHEINNPAAAAARSSAELERACDGLLDALRQMATAA